VKPFYLSNRSAFQVHNLYRYIKQQQQQQQQQGLMYGSMFDPASAAAAAATGPTSTSSGPKRVYSSVGTLYELNRSNELLSRY
jgi:hypothetical protein